KRVHMGTVIKNRGTSCVGVRKTGTTLIRVSTVMGTLYIEPDFYSEEHSIIGEIFAHIGGNKRGQSTKIANDILKMLLIEKDRCKSYRKIIVVCDEQEERTLSGKSALAESIRQFGIELKRVEISNELRETILSAQNRQVMING
ncbi:hypothetical protein ACTQ30_15875, partial [Roseburia faecis]